MRSSERAKLIKTITEIDGLSNEDRSELLGLLKNDIPYGLVWEDKPEDVEERFRKEIPVILEAKDRAIISSENKSPNHILIEGDNLESLTVLSYTHSGKIDVIYIDPPYNTGNKDFKYNDAYVNEDDAYRHSMWLSFMNKRLKIAKTLLSDQGVIFISIDNKEYAQLRLLCDKIFKEANFLGDIVWETATDNNPTQIATVHEYILCYANNKDNVGKWSITSDKAMIIKDKYEELKKQYGNDIEKIRKNLRAWIRKAVKSNDVDLSGVSHYDYVDEKGVFYPGNSANTKPGGYSYDIIHPVTGKVCAKPTNGYRWPKSTFDEAAARGDVFWGKDETKIPKIKKRIETATELLKSCYYEDGRAATNDLEEILGSRKFNNPKPVRLIKKLINFSSSPDSIILDFFAGSGTTLQATMELNAEDGGHRQCILATNNENNICEDVTYVRCKRVIQGYTKSNGAFVDGLLGNNLRYYRTYFINRKVNIKNMRALVKVATDMLCIKENVYNEKINFCGEKTGQNSFRFFEDDGKKMIVIYNESYVEKVAELLDDYDGETKIKLYVFSPSEDPWADTFDNVIDKVELCALPSAIYNAYRSILPPREDLTIISKDAN